jgi:nicotinamidase-related amidase
MHRGARCSHGGSVDNDAHQGAHTIPATIARLSDRCRAARRPIPYGTDAHMEDGPDLTGVYTEEA